MKCTAQRAGVGFVIAAFVLCAIVLLPFGLIVLRPMFHAADTTQTCNCRVNNATAAIHNSGTTFALVVDISAVEPDGCVASTTPGKFLVSSGNYHGPDQLPYILRDWPVGKRLACYHSPFSDSCSNICIGTSYAEYWRERAIGLALATASLLSVALMLLWLPFYRTVCGGMNCECRTCGRGNPDDYG